MDMWHSMLTLEGVTLAPLFLSVWATELVPCRGSKAGDGWWWWQVAGGEIPAEVAGGETPAEMAGGGIPMVVASGGGWQVAAVVVVG
ncbi:unnamed protein product [Prunus armeniaca]